MNGGDEGPRATQVWRGADVAALAEAQRRPGRGGRRGRKGGGGAGRSRTWQIGWRVGLWLLALALGWYLGVRYFG